MKIRPIDVPGGDLGGDHVALVNRKRTPVVAGPPHPAQAPGVQTIEPNDLALRRLPVHSYVPGRLLDQAVGFARHHVGVLGQADVERLARAAQGQIHLVGNGGAGCRDRHRALEAGDRAAERLRHGGPLSHPAGHDGRDDLGVGGDFGRQLQPLREPKFGMVVDVPVEGGDDVAAVSAVQLLGVERMGVRLGNDPDTRPTGVADHGGPRPGAGQGPGEEGIAADGGPQGLDVVAQFADLGRGFVHEAEAPGWRPDGARSEERIGTPPRHRGTDRRVVEVQVVAGDQHVDSG